MTSGFALREHPIPNEPIGISWFPGTVANAGIFGVNGMTAGGAQGGHHIPRTARLNGGIGAAMKNPDEAVRQLRRISQVRPATNRHDGGKTFRFPLEYF